MQIFFPAAPGLVEIVAVVGTSNSTANVFWIAPTQPNGVITGYQVIYFLYGDASSRMSQAVAGNVNNFVIINLSELITKLISYIATVSAAINDLHIILKSM